MSAHTPAAARAPRVISSVTPVISMRAASGRRRAASASSESPEPPGIFWSDTIASTGRSSRIRSASAALSAVTISKPSRRSERRSAERMRASSSTSSTQGSAAIGLLPTAIEGQQDPEERAAPGPPLDADRAAVAAHDAVAGREAEPRPHADLLRGEEGVEQPPEVLRSDADAVVLDLDLDAVRRSARAQPDPTAPAAGADARFDRLEGVHQQVHEDLLELHREAAHGGELLVLLLEHHEMLHHRPDDVRRGLEALVHVCGHALAAVLVREVAQVAHDVADALGSLLRLPDRLGQVREQVGDLHFVRGCREALAGSLPLLPLPR